MRQTALTLAVRLLGILAGLASSIATARYLGAAGRGIFFYWSTVAALIVQFGNFGLHASNVYLHARKNVGASVLASNSSVTSIAAGSALTLVAVAFLSWRGHPGELNPEVVTALILMSVGGLYSLLGSNLLVAMNRLTEFNFLELFSRVLALCSLLAMLVIYPSPVRLLTAIGVATTVAAGGVFWRLNKVAPTSKPSFDTFRQGLSYGLRAYVVACIATLVARLNAFLLEPALSPIDFGAWSIAAQIYDVLTVVPASIALVLLPRMMRSDKPRDMLKVNSAVTSIVMILLIAIFLLVGRPLIVLLYGKDFEPAFNYLLFGAPGLIALSVITILSQYMATIGFPRAMILIWSVVAVVHAAIATTVAPIYGAIGAMASQSAAYVIGLLLIYILIRYRKDHHA